MKKPLVPQILAALNSVEPLIKTEPTRGKGPGVRFILDADEQKSLARMSEPTTLVKSIVNMLNGPSDSIERLAFEIDPSQIHNYASVYRRKNQLIPDELLKRIGKQDDLVAAIVLARSNHIASFGHPRPDRFSKGYVIEPNVGITEKLTPDQKTELDKRIEVSVAKLKTCGNTSGWDDQERCPLSQWMYMSARDAVLVGRLATEIVWVDDVSTKEKKFHSFRAIDAGTIYKATPQKAALDSIRKDAFRKLQELGNKKLTPEKFQDDEYAWIQVIREQPQQAFTSKECVVHNFYPVTDIELDGYPVTPIDTMLSAVTTHINITTHNKLYFQSGRATRGMLVFKSDDVDESAIARIKQQFNASINNVNNSWRMPVFSVGTTDDITWSSIDSGGNRDMEFQYLTDMNARVIMSAFMMSPEELPGWSYLSRGTSNQGLAETNNEFKITAARDLGIRPLLTQFEDFLNEVIFPLLDPQLAKICKVRLMGLDAETAEKESIRLQQDAPLHMTYDQVLQKVEKNPIGKSWGGEFPLNPQVQQVLDKYFTVGQILEQFMGVVGAASKPELNYYRDPFWFQFQQLQQAAAQMQMQQQQAQAQAVAGPPQDQGSGPGGETPPSEGVEDQGTPQNMDAKDKTQKDSEALAGSALAAQQNQQPDLTNSINQAIGVMSKSEDQLPASKRRILAQHKAIIAEAMSGWEKEIQAATDEIMSIAENYKPKRK